MLDDILTSEKNDKVTAKDNHEGMSPVQRELYVFGGAAKDSATTAVESPGSLTDVAIGAATGIAFALIEPRARPLKLSMEVLGMYGTTMLGLNALNSAGEAKQIWDRTWKGSTSLNSDRKSAGALTDKLASFAAVSAGAMAGPAMRAMQFRRQWQTMGDLTFFGKRPAVPPEADLVKSYRHSKSAIGMMVMSENGNSKAHIGTGFLVDEDGAFLTCMHNIRGATTTDIVLPGKEERYGATLLGTDDKHDIALLRLTKKSPLEKFPYLSLSKNEPAQNKPAVVVGYPVGVNQSTVKLSTGEFRNTDFVDDVNVSLFAIPTKPGFSGSPILDDQGEVISMVKQALAINDREFAKLPTVGGRYSLGVQADDLHSFLKMHRNLAGTKLPQFKLENRA